MRSSPQATSRSWSTISNAFLRACRIIIAPTPEITGAELYAYAQQAARDAGWEFGGVIAGHVVSEFAHAWIPGEKDLKRIGPNNPTRMRGLDPNGRETHWILEIHLVDRARNFGGFYERLL